MSNKTISINPSLFSIGSSKTKKNREKKVKPNIVPIISPNVLKNKLLKRIKEHKQKENQTLEINKNKIKNEITNVNNSSIKNNSNNEILNFDDEFTDSINYLQTLAKQKRSDIEKKNYELEKQKRKEELERKTIKNYHSISQQPIVNIDLPDELIQPALQISTPEPIMLNQYTRNDVPYGILKGGIKPSYREWSRTQKNNIVTNPNSSLIIEGGNLSLEKTARENRLNLLKQKIKNKTQEIKLDPLLTENLIKKPLDNEKPLAQTIIINTPSEKPEPEVQFTNNVNVSNMNVNDTNVNDINGGGKLIATKHITKKTIKRKYTLGRSQIKRTVGVLIKDRTTRKKILTAQKDLKRKNINDIKIYLKEHNLIKTGSNAPNDVLRKLYESAMLTGEITNSNIDTLLHNFSKEDKKL
jgi:hypothetical protein